MNVAVVAIRDLGSSLVRLPLAFWLALEDVNGRYRRTVLGPLWLALGHAATIAGLVLVFSGLFGVPPQEYAVYLAAGIPVWALMSQYLVDMPLTFISARPVIESFELPWLLHIWRRSIGYILVFLHHLVTLVAVMAIMRVQPHINMLFAIPALLIVMIAGTGFGMLLAVVNARYRDVQHAMSMAMGFLFLFTPVMWRAEQLSASTEWAYQYNPLYYYVSIVREPLLGQVPTLDLWLGAGTGAIVLFFTGFLVFLLCRRRLYHWL